VQPPQDNHNNIVKKLETKKTALKIASQPPKKQVENENEEKIEYARSVFLNARRLSKMGLATKMVTSTTLE
jgi:hypothetical protein